MTKSEIISDKFTVIIRDEDREQSFIIRTRHPKKWVKKQYPSIKKYRVKRGVITLFTGEFQKGGVPCQTGATQE